MAKLPHFGVDEEEKKKKKKKIQQAKATPLKVKTKTTNKKAKAKAPVKRTDDSTRSHTFNYNKDVKQKKKRNPLSFILRKTGNEAYGGLAGLEQAGSTEAINALKKGQKSKKKGTADTLKTFAEASFMPIHMLNSTIEAGKNFVKSKKSTKDKLINLGLDLSESMIDTKGIELVGKLAPKKTTKEAIKTIKEADEFVSKPYEKNAEKLNEESANYGQGTNFVADTMGVVGRMAPSIGATALTKNPNVGLVTMGVSAKGSSTKEALNRGADLDTAIKIGTAKGLIEVGTEKLTGGLHYLGKGSLDDIAEKGIQKTLSKVGGQGVKRALLDKGLHGLYDVLGENLEEWITDVVDTQIDKATVDPKAKYTLADWGQTTALTTASTIVLNLLTRGMVGGVRVDMDKAINQTENQLNTKFTDKEKNLLKDNALKDLMYKNAYDKANNRIQENKKLINKKVQEAMTLNQNKTLNTTEAQRNKINDAINIKTAEIQALKQQNKLLTDRLENNENFNSLGRYKSNDSRLAQIEQAIPSEMYDTPINIEAIEQNQYDNDSRVANLLVSARQNLNNSEASQSFVKMLSNLAENKGYNIVFNPDMGENINGRIVTNENAKTIELNPNSDKSATFVLMHELSHDIGTQEISEDINNFRGENAIFNEWYEKRSQLYREQTNLSEEEIQEEMMCDSIGELLGNEEYLNHLTTKPTLMQKIMDWINKFLGRTEKGSQEYNYLQQLKQDFEKAYNGEETTTNLEKNSQELESSFSLENLPEVKDGYTRLYRGLNSDYDSNYDRSLLDSPNGYDTLTDNYELAKQYGDNVYYIDIPTNQIADSVIDENPNSETYGDRNLAYKDDKPAGLNGVRGNEYLLYTDHDNFNSNDYHKVENIKNSQNLISDKDSEGRTLSKQQQDYFKDSKVRDNEGKLIPVYHWTPNEFTVFDKDMIGSTNSSTYLEGFYFANKMPMSNNGNTMQVYLDIKNPITIDVANSPYDTLGAQELVDGFLRGETNYMLEYLTEYEGYSETEAENLIDKWETADGIIFKNTNYDISDTEYVVFEPNQIKNIDNTNPTTNDDIRYSQNLITGELVDNKGKKVDLQTSDTGNTGTLMAIHNLNEDKLKGILELGGFPVPSIAITNPDIVNHQQFGDISVLFDKSTIDPAIADNEVYDRDVWSPTFPQIDYELNEKGIEKVAKDLGIEEWRLRDAVEDSKPEYLVERLLREEQLIDKYINDNNIDYETAYKDAETRVDMHQRGKKLRKFIIDKDFDFRKLYQNKKLQQEYFDLIKDYYENANFPPAVKENLYNEKINQLKEYIDLQKGAGDVEPIRQLIKYQNDFDLIKSGDNKVVDTWQTEKNKKEASIKNGIEDYLQEEIKNVYGEKGIRNDREIFTPSGNRRSFWQLHDEYNLENIVDNLTKGDTTGTQSWIAGFGQIQANMSNRFNSIDDIKANENKLTSLAENNEVLEEARNNIENDIDEIVSRNDTDITIVSELLADFARGDLTVENFKYLTSNYYQTTQNVPDSLINKIIDDMNNLKNLPTDYFEAKPQRAVGLDEVKAVVIPNNINSDLKRELQNKGLPIVEYDKNIEGDKSRVINQFDNIKFSQNLKGEEVKDFATELADLDPEVMAQAFLEKEGDRLKEIAKDNGNELTDKQLKQLYRQHVGKISPENAFRIISEAISNRNYEIDRLAKITKNNDIKFWGDHINNMQGEIETNLNTAQIDENGNVVGKPVVEIFEPYAKDGRGAMFNDYLFHRSNIERHNNGVGSQVPMEESIQAVKDYEKENPDFKAGGDEVNNYFVNLLNFQVRCGIISQETANNILNKYKFYVPFYENEYLDDTFVGKTSDEIRAGSTLKRAQGGADKNLMPFEEAMARQTQQAISNGYKNELYKQIVNSLPKKAIDIMENLNPNESNALIQSGKKHYLTAFENGTPVQTEISQELYNELNKTFENYLKSVEKTLGFIAKPLQKGNEIKRNLVTTWSPSFVVTNPIKDIQDAFLNTKYPKDFAKNYSKAFKQILTGKDSTGELQKFLYKYGKPNIMGDYSLEGVNSDVASLIKSNGKINKSALAKVAQKIPQINEMLEMAPRYAEYLASLENGCSQLEALYNAREVTINFGRGGWFVKFLNRNGATFLNAQVQGFSKFFRNFHDAPVRTSMRATAYGLSMALINQLMYGDDDDYDLLPDYIKDNYYLFKVSSNEELKAMPKDMKEKYIIKKGKSTFIRIPRGRMLSIFSSMINRGKDRALGKRDELTLGEDIKSWGKNAWTQVGLPDIGSTNLFAPITQARSNKAWYGGQIVPNRLLKDSNGHNIPAKQQYDASTDKVSIWLGQKTGWSPYKINYVLDQYTGGIGDMLMPLITEEAQSSSNSRIGQVLAPLKDKFTADTINDNKNVTNFYTKAEKLGTKSLEENATGHDKLKSGYMDNVSYQMGALYKQIREVQADKNLSKKEKYERYEVLKSQINELAKNGLQNVNKVKGDEYYGEVEEDGKKKQLFRSSGGNYYELYDNQKEALDSANLSVKERNNLYKTKDEISKYMSSTKDNIRYSKRYKIIKNSNNSQSAKAILYNQNKQYYQKDPTPLVKDNLVDSFLDIESQNIKSDYKNGKIVYNSKRNKIAKAINKLNISSSDKAKLFNFYYPNAKLSTSGARGSGSSKRGSSGSKKAPTKGSKRTTTTKTPKITRTKVTPVKLSNNKVKIAPVKSKSTSNSKYYQEALKNLLFK